MVFPIGEVCVILSQKGCELLCTEWERWEKWVDGWEESIEA
jgi:hypothetical protein